jgi:hypothetical protein
VRVRRLAATGAKLARRGALAAALLLGLAGCPLQTPAVGLVTPGLSIDVSSGAPLVNEPITLTASFPLGGVDLSSATWTTSSAQILALSSTKGASISATAVAAGDATVIVTAGALRGAVTITVLDSAPDIAIVGPTSMTAGTDATYSATVTNALGSKISATVTWAVSPPGGGVLVFETQGSNTGSSIQVHAAGTGDGFVTAAAGGRAAQVAVKVSETSGPLVLTKPDGTPVPSVVAAGSPFPVQASYQVTSELANDAHWAATGTCMLVGGSGSSLSVVPMGSGTCTITATAKGMQATATFQIVSITSIMVVGDRGPIAIGSSRTFMAIGLAGMMETGPAVVSWSTAGPALSLMAGASEVKVMGAEVGTGPLVATMTGLAPVTFDLTVAPVAIKISAPGSSVLSGAGTTVIATAVGAGGKALPFAGADGVTIAGTTGFGSAGTGVLQNDGTVTFALGQATAASPAVTVSFGGVTSNALAFTVAQVAKVAVMGPQGPIRMGSGADFRALPMDAMGAPIAGNVAATWDDPTGVYQFPPANGTLLVTANAVKLGTSAIVATVGGISSMPYASPVQPSSIGITAFSPTSIGVGGSATTTVTVLDTGGQPIPGVPLSQVSIMADDGTKVSFDAGVLTNMGFVFTATGLAQTPAKGVNVQATWTDGMFPVQSTQVPLVVTP